ncbi:MAG: MFS transporter [Eubacteriales bacterium]|nr:MFS transporter [Eubacteriales bacterium]
MDHEQAIASETIEERNIPHFPLWRIILYSLGGAGNVLIGTLAGLATYFYIPPESGQADFPQYLSTNTLFGFTIFGVIMFVASLLPTILGPFVASWSDRSRSKLGRRKMFMVVSFLPIAVLSYMIFTPPVHGTSAINAWYLFGVMILLNVFRSLNGVSGAIPPEFGTTSKTMMQFSTFGSVGWILGYLIGSQLVFLIKDGFASSGMTTLDAFRITVLLLVAFGCVLSIFQFAVIDEKKYGRGLSSSINLGAALKMAFKNKLYVRYTLVNQVYAWGDAIFNTGLIYFVTINYGLPEYMMTAFGAALIGISLVLYPFVNIVARKIGKKPVFMASLVIMAGCLMLFGFPNLIPLNKLVVAWIIVGLASIYSAVTGILPGAIINEIVREDCVRTGIPNEAAYNAAGGLITAIPGNIPALVIPSLLLLGKSAQNHTGVTLVAVVSGICLLAAVILIQIVYNEKQIVASLREHGYE